MAGRRARVKLAPNLGLTRNKNKAVPVTPKIIIKSDTENSESEADDIIKHNPSSTVENDSEHFLDQVTAPVEPTVTHNGVHVEVPSSKPTNNVIVVPEVVETVEITPLVNGDKPDTANAVAVNGADVAQEAKTQDNVVTNGENKTVNRPRVPGMRGRNKFRPNLNFDRSRHGSGGAVQSGSLSPRPRPSPASNLPQMNTRSRTISTSSTNSETEAVSSSTNVSRPPPGPGVTSTDSPILRAAITTHKPARIRRTTESSRSTIGDRSQFLRRKLDHKKKFSGGVPDRGSLTMFDLIYYNPSHGQRMSVEEIEENVDDPDHEVVEGAADVVKKAEENINGEGLTELDEGLPKSEAIPVPQVKIGVNGELIVDEASLQVETTQAKEAKIMMKNSTLVFESSKTANNYGRWSKKRRHNDWSQKETIKFFRALSVVGSDFSLMESIFKNRSRQELKLKFKKEEKINTKMVDKCLNERGMFTDLESLMKESDEEDEEEEDADFGSKQRSRPKKKRPGRRRYKNRGYYESSSDGEEADVEASKSPVRRTEAEVKRVKRPQVVKSRHQEVATDQVVEIIEPAVTSLSQSEGVLASLGQSQQLPPGIQFPPGLLAANPSLVGAKPGSLVVVASPHKPDNPLLSVFMVPENNEKVEKRDAVSPRHPPQPQAASGSELRLDPAVVRAVDRGRLNRQRTLSGSETMAGGRKRTFSEMEVKDGKLGADARSGRVRQRTYSESGLDTRSDGGGKKRFLSGSSGKL